ncbi:hypothetical protein HPB48_004626 [Haemaphysalis longicornis]|uniref:Uncharacterized protein n=1 Tax=Haemaphysalis longicornis TaxID=44386 RepID=A0A9J6GTQ1_HAELO|nr:hypothetical protein HPB48_004626 [Haemaphysalis longicornis]
MSFAEQKALLQAKLRIAEAKLAAERSKSERFKRANNVPASPIAQTVMFSTEGESELGCSGTPKDVRGGTHSLGVHERPVSRDSARSESRGKGEKRIVAHVTSWALRFPATGEQDSEASRVKSFTKMKTEVKEGVTCEAAFGNDRQSEMNESVRVKKLIARETASAASHVRIHVTDESLATPCVTQRCVVENGASCAHGGSVTAEHGGSHRKEPENYEVLESTVPKGLGLASVQREPVIAACGDGEHSGSVVERPVALQDAAEPESRKESAAVGVAHIASCVSGDPQMSCRENVIAMGSSSEFREESVLQGPAAHVMQPQGVAGRTVGVAEEIASPALHVSVDVAARQPSADYADEQRVVEHGAPSSRLAELGCSDKKGRKRQPASPQCSVAAMQADEAEAVPSRARKRGGEGFPIMLRQSASPQCSVAATLADEPAAVPSRARKRGGEGPLILLCEGVRRMARTFSDDDGRCVPPSKGR